jgi:hypothetical protein
MPVPTLDELNPDKGDLDQQSAADFFHNKSLAEAEKAFSEFSLDCAEHLMWMGPKAFTYYFKAAHNYLTGSNSEGDDIFIRMMIATFEVRFIGKHTECELLEGNHDLVADFCSYVTTHISKFDTDIDSYSGILQRYRVILSKLT